MTSSSDKTVQLSNTPALAASVSVLIPAFNAEKTIDQTLRSATTQAISEILVIDDGSTDQTAAIAKDHPQTTVVSTPNRGVSTARNLALSLAAGDYVVFLDADDLLLTDTIARRMRDIGTATATYCGFQEFDTAVAKDSLVRTMTEVPSDVACASVGGRFWAPPAAWMFNRRWLLEQGVWFQTHLPVIQDARFIVDLASAGATFVHSEHVGAGYRTRTDSLSRRSAIAFAEDCQRNAEDIEARWSRKQTLDTPQRRQALIDTYDFVARTAAGRDHILMRKALAAVDRHGGQSRFARVAKLAAKLGGDRSQDGFGHLARRWFDRP